MKKITLALLLLSSFTALFAQAPQKMNYQSVIRKTDGTLLVNTSIGIKTSILLGSPIGTASYVETQTITTNVNGLATLEIGGGIPVTGTFAAINWGAGSHFIKTEIDPAGGTNYTISGTSQLLSVPYALYAGSSVSKGKTSIILTGDITDADAVAQIQAELGPYTENVYVTNTTNLTTLDLSTAKSFINLTIMDNTKLSSIKLDNLIEIYGDLEIENNEKLSSLVFPVFTVMHGYEISIGSNPTLTSISFPVLSKTKGIYFTYNASLTSISFPMLSKVYTSQTSLNFNNNALPSSQVNAILNKLLDISPANTSPTSGNFIQLQGQNPAAPPTGQGLTDKATLISRGNSVSTD
ncbi:hypothetical protein K6T82_08955 [Flavobacterium sp. 17A]|uniref:Uncharacterized protein n=1 Tax=Flavobacterium potami TaxID=2872310 RepID=A0A9X1HAH5_9FLAO|nr:hypothetical protein [Flavobacterium potami]MBZ4034894.1 hypothetical protein [Flavobacterium potami]